MKFLSKLRGIRPRADISEYARRVAESGLFDAKWYIKKYPELASFASGPLAHFCEYGLYEHRDPGPNFDTRRYLIAVPDAGTGPLPPFLRALDEGEVGDERPCWMADDAESLAYLLSSSGLLDDTWYKDTYPDVARSGMNVLDHYLRYGAVERRDPGPNFDAEHYALSYPACQSSFSSPIEHYLRVGIRRGLFPKGASKFSRWTALYDELTDGDLARIGDEPACVPVSCVFLLSEPNFGWVGDFLETLHNQVGASWCVRFVRTPALDVSSWKDFATKVAAETRIVCIASVENLLAELVDEEVVLFCSAPCRLRPHACHVFASALIHANVDAAYCDHDRMAKDGVRHAPVFKPSMSPLLMRQVPYAGPVITLRIGARTRSALIVALNNNGDLNRNLAGVLLELHPDQVLRIPLILYHEVVDHPVRSSLTNQPVASAKIRTLPFDESSGLSPTVSIIIPTRDHRALLKDCIDSILKTSDYPSERFNIIVVDNDSQEDETWRYYEELTTEGQVNVIFSPGSFNFSKICNDGAANADSEILVFLNNDMTVRQPDWLQKLVALAGRQEVGAVGARLLYPDDAVQHGGVVLGINGVGTHVHVDVPEETVRLLDVTREISAVTGACLAIRRSLFIELGGFDPVLRVDFNDVDVCCRASQAGYTNCYVAEAFFYHHESLSRGRMISPAMRGRNGREAIRVMQRHAPVIRDDPFYNPNLSLTKVFHLADPPRVVPRWRRPARRGRRVLILSVFSEPECEIGRLIAEQQRFLVSRGFEVIVGGGGPEKVFNAEGSRYVPLANEKEAAIFAVNKGVDAIIAHTAPFYSLTRHLGRRPLVYVMDHGAPSPTLFPDCDRREVAILEKRVCASLARRVFTTSIAARDALFGQETIILSHDRVKNALWSNDRLKQRQELRAKFGFSERFVVLNFCRTGELEHRYNGFEDYVALAAEYAFTDAALAGRALFVAADPGPLGYPADRLPMDLVARGGVSDAELVELLAASDLYLTTQRWQGADCGIAPALAMGLPVIASDIPAHRTYPIETTPDVPGLCRSIAPHAERWRSGEVSRHPVLLPGPDPLAVLADTIAADIDQDSADHWI